MFKTFEKNLITKCLIKHGDGIVIAVSGGVDSMTLLNLLWRLKKDLGLKLIVAHVNHRLRGKISDTEEEMVRKISGKLKIPFFVAHWKVPKSGNIQDMARRFRYNFFKEVAMKNKVNFVATAHHQDDQAETFLLHLIRGSGIKGLGSMEWRAGQEKIELIRPLLGFSRNEIESYAKRSKLIFADDLSNKKINYRRNLIRHKLLPLLESLNPRIKEAIAETADALQNNYTAVDVIAKAFADEYFAAGEGKIVWQRAPFVILPIAIRRHVLIEAFERLKGDRKDLNSDQIVHMEELSICSKLHSKYMLPKSIKFHRQKDLLFIQRS